MSRPYSRADPEFVTLVQSVLEYRPRPPTGWNWKSRNRCSSKTPGCAQATACIARPGHSRGAGRLRHRLFIAELPVPLSVQHPPKTIAAFAGSHERPEALAVVQHIAQLGSLKNCTEGVETLRAERIGAGIDEAQVPAVCPRHWSFSTRSPRTGTRSRHRWNICRNKGSSEVPANLACSSAGAARNQPALRNPAATC